MIPEFTKILCDDGPGSEKNRWLDDDSLRSGFSTANQCLCACV